MAKKITPSPAAQKSAPAKSSPPAVEVTPIRNSVVPPKSTPVAAAAPARKAAPAPTYDSIALCAYFMWKKGGGSEFDNWLSAEQQLRSV